MCASTEVFSFLKPRKQHTRPPHVATSWVVCTSAPAAARSGRFIGTACSSQTDYTSDLVQGKLVCITGPPPRDTAVRWVIAVLAAGKRCGLGWYHMICTKCIMEPYGGMYRGTDRAYVVDGVCGMHCVVVDKCRCFCCTGCCCSTLLLYVIKKRLNPLLCCVVLS